MQCETFENRLNDAPDARIDPLEQPELQAHLEACQACQATWNAYERLLLGLEIDLGGPSRDFTTKVLEQVTSVMDVEAAPAPEACGSDDQVTLGKHYTATPSSPRRKKPARTTWLVLAGCLTVLLGFAGTPEVMRWLAPVEGPQDQDLANVPTELDVQTPQSDRGPDAPAQDTLESPTETAADSAIAELDEDATTADVAGSSALTRERLTLALKDLAARSTEEAAERFDSVETIARPITSSFSIAIGALRRTLPVGRSGTLEKPQAGTLPTDFRVS